MIQVSVTTIQTVLLLLPLVIWGALFIRSRFVDSPEKTAFGVFLRILYRVAFLAESLRVAREVYRLQLVHLPPSEFGPGRLIPDPKGFASGSPFASSDLLSSAKQLGVLGVDSRTVVPALEALRDATAGLEQVLITGGVRPSPDLRVAPQFEEGR
jgi:hypothetical protein